MKSQATFIFLIFLVEIASAQKIDSIIQLLQTTELRSAVKLMKKGAKEHEKNSYVLVKYNVIGFNSKYAEIVLDYREVHEHKGKEILRTYTLNAIADTNTYKLIYYSLKNFDKPKKKPISSNKNEEEIQKLKLWYKENKEAELWLEHMFKVRIIYGSDCGLGGIDPIFRSRLNTLVNNTDTFRLDNWLHSARPGIQVYAVDGFYQLHQLGIEPNPEQMKLIESLKKRSTYIWTCAGCNHTNESMNKALLKIEW